MTTHEIELVQRTPIWMSGANGVAGFHETGFVGGLRWWAAALLRGLGYRVLHGGEPNCCERDGHDDSGLCPLCRAFGCTGHKRRFQVRLVGDELPMPGSLRMVRTRDGDEHGGDEHHGYPVAQYAASDPCLRFSGLFGDGVAWEPLVHVVLKLLDRWAGIGAKTAMGHGVFELAYDQERAAEWGTDTVPPAADPARPSADLPDLRHFVFSQYTITGRLCAQGIADRLVRPDVHVIQGTRYECLPCAMLVREKLRRTIGDGAARHWLMGEVHGDQTRGSKVFVSHAWRKRDSNDDWRMRVWAWLPPSTAYGTQVTQLRHMLSCSGTMPDLIRDALVLEVEAPSAAGNAMMQALLAAGLEGAEPVVLDRCWCGGGGDDPVNLDDLLGR